jgi:ligand-binding sensor domain-containing protein/signal transduction histidine kinase
VHIRIVSAIGQRPGVGTKRHWYRALLRLALTGNGPKNHLAIILAAVSLETNYVAGFTNLTAGGEGLSFRSWGTEAGLPQNTVNAIVQTRDGYLWIGTRDGLARFDGVRFTTFGLHEGLPSVEVLSLYEDRRGTLWIGTSGGGLSRWAAGHIETVTFPQHLAASGTVTSLAEDAATRLWIGTRAGLTIWEHGRFTQNAELAWLANSGIRALLYDHDSGMWIATLSKGLYEFRENRLKESLAPPGNERILAYCLLEDASSNLWASIGNGTVLHRHNGEWHRFTETDGLPFAYVTCLAQDQAGTIWAGSLDDGLYYFKEGRFFGIRKQQGLSANDIRSLCPDRDGNLWVGTRTGGLNRVSRCKLESWGAPQGLTNDYTRSVAETADGVLWVGTTGGGLYRGDAQGFKPFAPYFSSVESVLSTKDGSLWWGAARGLFHLQNGQLVGSYTNETWLGPAAVTALCEDDDGGLWAGTSEGRLVHFQNGAFTEINRPIAQGPITGLAQEPAGPMWVGSMAGGLKRIELATGAVESVTNGLLSHAIRTLYLDPEGVLWIGAAGGGLSRYRGGRITTFTAREGLNANTVVQIVEDDYGFLWLATSRGVLRVRKNDLNEVAAGRLHFLHPRAFGINDGMPAEECSSGFSPAGLKTQAGLVCISTVKGLVFFDPRNQVTNSSPPTVLLEEVLVNGQVLQPVIEPPTPQQPGSTRTDSESAPSAGQVILPPGSRDLELHYTGISFSAPERLRFRYQLEGVDHDWIEAGERRTAYYHRVPPGKFLFRVLACNADGVWSPTGPTLAVTAEPYLWETGWFLGLAGLAMLGILAGSIRLVERRRYRRRLALIETRHAVERERLRISQDMHDDVGSILTQVSQLSDLGQSETGGPAAAKGHFQRIGSQARAAVQALDEIVWATNPKNDNLSQFVEYVCRFADEWFENSPVRCWQEVPTVLPKVPLRAEVRHNVFLAIKEAFNNVLKHSGATEVWLRLTLQDSEVCVSIEDNGRGFEPEKTGRGTNGLENMKARLTDCGGRTELSSTPGRGTRIQFRFPLPSLHEVAPA